MRSTAVVAAALLASGCKTPGTASPAQPPPLELVAVGDPTMELAIWNELQAHDPDAHIEAAKKVWLDMGTVAGAGPFEMGAVMHLEPESPIPATWPKELEREWREAHAECLK